MNVYLIKASSGSDFSKYKAETGGPSQSIFSTAAATPQGVGIEMTDETIGMKTNFKSKADVVAVFMSTPDALRAYEIADEFKAQGKVVVLGGLHTRFCMEEAREHAHTLLIGEVEGVWEELLADAASGDLKPLYQRSSPVDMAELNPYPTHIIKPSKYKYIWSVVVSRGCPNTCEFCLVPRFFPTYRHRPIPHIVEELKALKKLGVSWVELHADNLTADRAYAMELFKALAPLKMKFYGETTVLLARDLPLLEAAQKAGVKGLMFGIETPDEAALKAQGKAFVRPEKIKSYIQTVKSYGIEVWGDFLFGFDEHDPSIFQKTLDFVREIKVDRVFPHMVIPFPGSATYEKMEAEGRILTRDWSKYDGTQVVFQPKNMTPDQLEKGLEWFWVNQYGGRIGNAFYRFLGFDSGKASDFEKKKSKSVPANSRRSPVKWKSLVALFLVFFSIWAGFGNIVFGLLFFLWSIYGIINRQTFMVEEIHQGENPVLFWTISITWLVLSVLSIMGF